MYCILIFPSIVNTDNTDRKKILRSIANGCRRFYLLENPKNIWISFSILQSSQKKYESGRYFNNFYNFVRNQKNKVVTY